MDDTELIDRLGGAAKVAELLGYDKQAGGVQRVHNWRARGIPSKVKVDHPELLLLAQRAPKLPAVLAPAVVESGEQAA